MAISANHQHVAAVEPAINFSKSIGPALHFDDAIKAEQLQDNIASESVTGTAGERDWLGREAVRDKEAHQRTFGIGFPCRENDGHLYDVAVLADEEVRF